ncbi:BrnA antitoxin family protein [uncultured Thiodictyon sp.]|uniref:BrnA antitoxin family protein n=1 Tax=uncultured Thiodictyon sp. TaxID=1846217 RepID=UPI0025DEE01C|nr:BrnA antitoxin family protein [uncultured Thiodictyon sp.]
MPVTSKSGRVFELPDTDEETAIRAGIATDPDASELSAAALKTLRRVGRPEAPSTKKPVSIRLSPEVLAYFKATGTGWQTRMDAVLRQFVDQQRPGH